VSSGRKLLQDDSKTPTRAAFYLKFLQPPVRALVLTV
jgi:hypothetical protein